MNLKTDQTITPQQLALIPEDPGVYIYKNRQRTIVYIGKAINLRKRVRQYFQRDDAVGSKTLQLVQEIHTIDTISTESEFDALLLEAKLIKQYQPKFNVIAKDDKSPLYVVLDFQTELPRLHFDRKPKDLDLKLSNHKQKILYIGPFQSAKIARNLLRSLRTIVPYCTQKQHTGKPCFYTHLGLCSPCPSYIYGLPLSKERKELTSRYRTNMFRLRDILTGKAVSVIEDLEQTMTLFSQTQAYEQATSVRNQIQALRTLLSRKYDPNLYTQSDTLLTELLEQEQVELLKRLQPFYPELKELNRIECFDISNIQGTNPTASMVVMTNGRINKDEYRKFHIKGLKTPNDFAMMQEVITRRFKHPEWQFPDLVVIDGGKGQVTSAKKALEDVFPNLNQNLIPIIGLAKREEEIIVPTSEDWKIIRLPLTSGGLKLLQRLRDEAHRFAVTYHRLLRTKAMKYT